MPKKVMRYKCDDNVRFVLFQNLTDSSSNDDNDYYYILLALYTSSLHEIIVKLTWPRYIHCE